MAPLPPASASSAVARSLPFDDREAKEEDEDEGDGDGRRACRPKRSISVWGLPAAGVELPPVAVVLVPALEAPEDWGAAGAGGGKTPGGG